MTNNNMVFEISCRNGVHFVGDNTILILMETETLIKRKKGFAVWF